MKCSAEKPVKPLAGLIVEPQAGVNLHWIATSLVPVIAESHMPLSLLYSRGMRRSTTTHICSGRYINWSRHSKVPHNVEKTYSSIVYLEAKIIKTYHEYFGVEKYQETHGQNSCHK
jgi:hypothetical protein